MGDFEQLTLLRLENPGIYLQELQDELLDIFGVLISVPTICRTLKYIGCTRQVMHRVALQRSDALRARFIAEISVYNPSVLVWLDETGCDRRHSTRKYGYSVRGISICDQRILIRGTRYTAIPVISTDGILRKPRGALRSLAELTSEASPNSPPKLRRTHLRSFAEVSDAA